MDMGALQEQEDLERSWGGGMGRRLKTEGYTYAHS